MGAEGRGEPREFTVQPEGMDKVYTLLGLTSSGAGDTEKHREKLCRVVTRVLAQLLGAKNATWMEVRLLVVRTVLVNMITYAVLFVGTAPSSYHYYI